MLFICSPSIRVRTTVASWYKNEQLLWLTCKDELEKLLPLEVLERGAGQEEEALALLDEACALLRTRPHFFETRATVLEVSARETAAPLDVHGKHDFLTC